MLINQPGSMAAIIALCRKHKAIWETQRGAKFADEDLADWNPPGWVKSAIREAYLLGLKKGTENATEQIP